MRRISILAAFTLASIVPAAAMDLPTRKAGLWELTIAMEKAGMPSQTMQHCTDEAHDKEMTSFANGLGAQQCQQKSFDKTATGYTFESACDFGGGKTTSRGTITGDFNSAYTIDMQSSGGPGGGSNMRISAKWLGACKAGQVPGDIVMPGGMKINISQMKAMMGGAGRTPPR